MSPNVSSSSSTIVTRVFSPTVVKQNLIKLKRDENITHEENVKLMIMHNEDECSESLSYEILCLLGPYMEPKTLAIASCVSTTWSHCFSSESLWKQVLTARSSNLFYNFTVAKETMERFSYKRFVSVVERDAKLRRKNQPEKPKISLNDLMFILHVSTTSSSTKAFYKKGKDLELDLFDDKFHIEVDVSNYGITSHTKDLRLIWQVVYKDWEKLLTIVDTSRSLLDTKFGWFTDELPVKESFSSSGNSKLAGDVRTSFNGEALEKIGFKIVNSSNDWVSLSLDDVLRYFELFFIV